MEKLKLTILNDNIAGRNCRAEHGLSFLVEADQQFLFDTGSSDLIFYNAEKLGIDLHQVETIVLSHGHDDHTGGLYAFNGQTLVCHPETFARRFRKRNGTALGIRVSLVEAQQKFKLRMSKEPLRLSAQVWFLGEIPRNNSFESQQTAFRFEDGTDDFIPDDSGLAVLTDRGVVVISGCAHSGICNMTEHALGVTGETRVLAVVGGFHLQKNDEVTRQTIARLQELGVGQAIPSHCTAFEAQAAFYQIFPFEPLKSGNVLYF
jgi:7,8-dihydropterin-6-yl-methyl-4-(beta-D-ribofuranosyl)aminobenzene 5'-phosphate synthase